MAKILIVDDDPSFGRFLMKVLAPDGHAASAAAAPNEALALAAANKPDLIIIDWCLGSAMDGIGLLKALRERPETHLVPVVLISGIKQEFEDEIKALASGADLFLAKSESADRKGSTLSLPSATPAAVRREEPRRGRRSPESRALS